jgi:hypothetical protein
MKICTLRDYRRTGTEFILSLTRNSMKRLCLLALLTATASCLQAEDFKRFEIQPFGGFAVSGDIPLQADDNTTYGNIEVKSSFSLGATFAVFLNSLDAIEGRWQRQFTDGQIPGTIVAPYAPDYPATFDLKIDQIHCNFIHYYRVVDPRAFPYVMAGIGATTYRAKSSGFSGSKSYFSFALGGGIKYLFNDHFGLRGEARWNPTLLSDSGSTLWCSIGGAGANCLLNLKMTLQQQLDLNGGVVFRF